MRSIRAGVAVLGLTLLASCGSPPPPSNSTAVATQVVAGAGPRTLYDSILAANDLESLRALVDAMGGAAVQQLGGTQLDRQCRPPYPRGGDFCWQGARSQPGYAYIALNITGAFCTDVSAPQLYRQAARMVLQVNFSTRFNCHLSGSVALPSATLISFPTRGLPSGLYAVSFRFVTDGDVYSSDSTYLSIPGPAAADQPTVESQASEALTTLTGDRRVGLFSVARVAGDQIQNLCRQTTTGPAYLVTVGPDLSAARREMTVVLAGPTPHTCAVSTV